MVTAMINFRGIVEISQHRCRCGLVDVDITDKQYMSMAEMIRRSTRPRGFRGRAIAFWWPTLLTWSFAGQVVSVEPGETGEALKMIMEYL